MTLAYDMAPSSDLWLNRDADPDYANETNDSAQAHSAHLLRPESAVAPHTDPLALEPLSRP